MSVVIEKKDSLISAKVWNRCYSADSTPAVLSSIISGNDEILAAPITLHIETSGKECEFCEAVSFALQGEEDTNTILRTFESNAVIVNISQSFEEDGCADVSISVMPRGRSVAEAFGLEKQERPVFAPNKFYMEVPIKKEFAGYYQIYPVGDIFTENKPISLEGYPDDNWMYYTGLMPKNGFNTGFKEQVYISGDKGGLGFFFESDEMLRLNDQNRAIEVDRAENGDVILRFNFLEYLHERWKIKEGDTIDPIFLAPLTFKFGMIATPVKPFRDDAFYERNIHIDCFKKIPENYDVFLEKEYPDGQGGNGYDRLERLGVKVLYVHEKWNDIQNCPFLTDETLERIKKIVSECHKRGIKVIPYFGYEISTLSPVFKKYGEKLVSRLQDNYPWHWYRYPYQRALPACMGSEWGDILFEGISRIYDECGFDGLYFDTLVDPKACKNTEHGCGYIGVDGELHATHPVWGVRKFMKKMYKFVNSRGGTINIHGSGACNLAMIGYCDSFWEGETFQSFLMTEKLKTPPMGIMRAQFASRATGIPVHSLCYANDPVWTFENGVALSLLHGAIPKPVDIGEPLEKMSKIWDTFDNFPFEKALWKPYWKPSDKVTADCGEVRISVWEAPDKYLCVCASNEKEFSKEVTINCDLPIIADVISGKALSENGSFKIKFDGFDYVLFTADKSK